MLEKDPKVIFFLKEKTANRRLKKDVFDMSCHWDFKLNSELFFPLFWIYLFLVLPLLLGLGLLINLATLARNADFQATYL